MKFSAIAKVSTVLMILGALSAGVKPATATTSIETEQSQQSSLSSGSSNSSNSTGCITCNSNNPSTSQSTGTNSGSNLNNLIVASQSPSASQLLESPLAQQLLESPFVEEFLESELVEQLLASLRVGTPANDILIGETATDIQYGRTGNDRFLGVNPASAIAGEGEVDVLIGGNIEDLFGNPIPTAGPDRNLFILGDYNQAYYAGNTGTNGTGDFALIVDFQTNQDFLRLNGAPSDYTVDTVNIPQLGEFGTATAIFRNNNNAQPDLIALLPGVSSLSLDANYIEYVTTPPPNEAKPGIQQIGSSGVDFSFSVASDKAGNAYLSGLTTGDLGGANAGSQDAWLAKYDSNGNQQWVRQLGSPAADNSFGTAVELDNTENVYITGFTRGSLGGPNAGANDAYLAKYDSDGNQQWIKQYGTDGLDTSLDLAIDSANNVYTAGFTTGDLGAPNAGQDDPYVAKYDSNGNLEWLTQFGTEDYDEAYGIDTDNFGNIFVTGWTLGDLAGTNAGLYDAWLAKLDNNGNRLWTRQFGTEDYEFAWDVATDSFGSAYVTGWTLGDLGGPNAGLYDFFLAKYDTNGNQTWIKQFGTGASDQAFSLDIDSNNNIYLSGFTAGTLGKVNAGGDILEADDAFWAKFDLDGNLLGVNQFGSSGVDRAFGIDAQNPNKVYVAGVSDGSLGGNNKGSFDSFVGFFKKVADHIGGGNSGGSCSI